MAHPLVHGGDGSGGPISSNPQMIQQFLSSVLSQRGPAAVPYTEDVKWLIRQHLVSLVDAFPSLQPKTATFAHNDGRTVNLLQAEGTVPMIYQDVTYNIPVIVWLMESYPRHPPFVYVNPTRDMVIKRPHPYVNPSGMVTIPYLQNWIYPSSNLVDLGRNLSHAFSRDPPLYSQQRRPNPNSISNPHPVTNFGLTSNGVLNSSSSMSIPAAVRPVNPPRVFPQASPYNVGAGSRIFQPSPSPPPPRTEDPTEVYRRNAINKLVEMAHSDIVSLRKTREAEMEGLFNAQAVLRQREEHLSIGLREMMNEKESLEQQLQMMLMNTEISETWLRDNESKVKNLNNLDIDDAFEPCDPLSKQMLDCTASDLAIEDTIYSLDKAVQEGSIPFDQYLRNVRLLSREQFFHRAMSTKIRGAQMQTQVANMAARISNYIS